MVNQVRKNPDVSVIIVSYNNFNFLEDCLKSLYNFTKNIDFEVIILDNNSTEQGLNTVVNKYDNILLIRNQENRGFAAANNQGILLARGEYILLLNNDTILLENSIKRVYDFARSKNGDVIIGCILINADGSLQHSVYDFPTVWNVFTSNFFLYLLNKRNKVFSKYHLMNRGINLTTEVDVVTGAFLFVNKLGIQNVGGFDERFYFYNEETDLCFRFKKNGGKIYYFTETKLIHIKGGTTSKNLLFKFKNQSLAQIKYFQKHYNGVRLFLLIIFHYTGIFIRIPILFFLGCITLNKNHIIRAYYFFKLLFFYPKNEFN